MYMWLSEQKPNLFAYKLKIILLPQLMATLAKYVTMQVNCLYWLMLTGLFFQSAFINIVNPRLVKWHKRRTPIWQQGPFMASTISVHLFCFVVEYWPFVGKCGCHGHSKLYCLCLLASFLAFATTHPFPYPSHPPLYICWPNINEFHENIM